MTVKSSGIVSRSELAEQAPAMRKILAFALMFLSWFGTFVCLNGLGVTGVAWERIIVLDARWAASFIIALAMQYVLTRGQWTALADKNKTLYALCLLPSLSPSVASYWLIVKPLSSALVAMVNAVGALFGSAAVTNYVWANILAAIIVIGVSAAIDIAPERILVKE